MLLAWLYSIRPKSRIAESVITVPIDGDVGPESFAIPVDKDPDRGFPIAADSQLEGRDSIAAGHKPLIAHILRVHIDFFDILADLLERSLSPKFGQGSVEKHIGICRSVIPEPLKSVFQQTHEVTFRHGVGRPAPFPEQSPVHIDINCHVFLPPDFYVVSQIGTLFPIYAAISKTIPHYRRKIKKQAISWPALSNHGIPLLRQNHSVLAGMFSMSSSRASVNSMYELA